jgi:hypothetical protein
VPLTELGHENNRTSGIRKTAEAARKRRSAKKTLKRRGGSRMPPKQIPPDIRGGKKTAGIIPDGFTL